MGLTTVASKEANRWQRDHENNANTTKVSLPYGMNDHELDQTGLDTESEELTEDDLELSHFWGKNDEVKW